MQGTEFTDIFYFIAIVGGTIALGAALAFAVMTRRKKGRMKSPGEIAASQNRPRTTTVEPAEKPARRSAPQNTPPQRH